MDKRFFLFVIQTESFYTTEINLTSES